MKQIQLQSLTLRNWRGEKERTTEFHLDAPTTISGGNGLGKSRHFDAFCWLLFGKDSQDRKDFELRTHDAQGNVLHRVECSVEATILIDGTANTLKREYKEKWTKPTGQIEEVFAGNITECTWNGTPVKVGEFNKRVQDEIIDDTLFKMLTNPRYFTEKMKWQQQREALLEMAGTASDEEIAATSDDFKALLGQLNGKPLSDFRKEIAAEKKRLKEQAAEIQPRIDQTQKMMPEAEDWAALEAQLKAAQDKLAEVDAQIASEDKRRNAGNEQRKALQQKIYDLQAQQRAAIANYEKQLQAEVYKENEQRRDIEAKLKTANSEQTELNIDRKRNADRVAFLQKEITDLNAQLDELRNEWHEIDNRHYDGSNTCPHCGQPLPEVMVATAEQKFKQHKAELLKMNNDRGISLATQRKAYTDELQAKEQEAINLETAYKNKENELKCLYEDLKDHPTAMVGSYSNNDVPQYAELQAEITKCENELNAPQADATIDLSELANKRLTFVVEIDGIKERLAKRAQIAKANEEIERLNEQGRTLAQQLADVEKREYIAAQFSKKRVEDCEQRINNMFTYVRFKLFDTTQDGNEFETCVPYWFGTPYGVTNTAGQVNAGLDIINTLCHFHNVAAPIFIDGAESVNTFLEVPSQVVFLQVTKDKKLVIK